MCLEKLDFRPNAKISQSLEPALASATLVLRLTADSFFNRGLQNENFNSFGSCFLTSPILFSCG